MTISATVYAYLFIHLGIVLVAAAYFTVGALLVPRLTGRARGRFAQRPWLPMLLGTAVSLPWAGLAIALLNSNAAALKFAGAVGGGLWVLTGLVGGAAIAQHLGGARRDAAPTWLHAFRGGLFLSMTWILPIIGWLLVLPLSLATGVGCLLLGFLPERSSAAPPAGLVPVGA